MFRSRVLLGVALLGMTATGAVADGPDRTGCGSRPHAAGGDWQAYGQDVADSRNQPAEHDIDTTAAGRLSPAWTFSVASAGDTGQFNSTPIVAHGCVYAASSTGVVYAIDADTGALVWRTPVVVTTPGLGGAIVGATIVVRGVVVVIVNESGNGTVGPFLLGLAADTGAEVWRSAPLSTATGYYSNASPAAFRGLVVAGYSPPEGSLAGQGGFGIVDARNGRLLVVTPTIPPADQAQGFAGGGLWSTAAFDEETGYAYLGGGNPFSKTKEHPNTNAILKIDVRRHSPAFGAIVASYKGNVDQYTDTLETLSHTPVCDATAGVESPVDDPACGQLDLDFGAAPNVFTVGGRTLVGDLQKAGVYHVADAATMAPVWSTIVGASCFACNAGTTATDGSSVYGVGTPGGVAFGLAAADGARRWEIPVGDGAHYEATSTANGVVYTIDGLGGFDAYAAATGVPVLHRELAADTGLPTAGVTSVGVSIARHSVYLAANSLAPSTAGPADVGFLISYRVPGGRAG